MHIYLIYMSSMLEKNYEKNNMVIFQEGCHYLTFPVPLLPDGCSLQEHNHEVRLPQRGPPVQVPHHILDPAGQLTPVPLPQLLGRLSH